MAGFTQRVQAIPGATVSPDEIAERLQLVYKRIRGTMTPEEKAEWARQQTSGGGRLPKNLAKVAKRDLFSSRGAFPEKKGGASFLEGLAEKANAAPPGAQAFGPKPGLLDSLGPGVAGLADQVKSVASKGLSGIPRAKGPTLPEFLESQGVPIIPVKARELPMDFLGNTARWWVKAASSPYLGTLVKLTFFVMFFLSFLESTPIIGSVVSAVLDIVLAAGRIIVKAFQKGLPALLGLIPLPYTQLIGVALVSLVGMFAWTLFATISFGRQDFTTAIESMLRITPIPIGDAMADAFLDVNRTVGQLNDKRIKLMDEIWNGLLFIRSFVMQIGDYVGDFAKGALNRVKKGVEMLMGAIQQAPEPPAPPGVLGAAAAVPMAMALAPGTPGAQTAPMATPVPGQIPTAIPVAPGQIPTATPVAPPGPEPVPPPVPTAPPVEAPPVPTAPPVEPVPTAPPVEAQPIPTAPPVEPVPPPAPTAPPAPVPEPPPPLEVGPKPKQSALDRLRSGQSVNRALNVGRGIRGGKTLSAKRRNQRKWTTRQRLYERFSGAGLR